MTAYVCPCEGDVLNVPNESELCDDPAYPPRGIAVCRRHGVDPCHDDAWHYGEDDTEETANG